MVASRPGHKVVAARLTCVQRQSRREKVFANPESTRSSHVAVDQKGEAGLVPGAVVAYAVGIGIMDIGKVVGYPSFSTSDVEPPLAKGPCGLWCSLYEKALSGCEWEQEPLEVGDRSIDLLKPW
jgi:hypothetical protein